MYLWDLYAERVSNYSFMYYKMSFFWMAFSVKWPPRVACGKKPSKWTGEYMREGGIYVSDWFHSRRGNDLDKITSTDNLFRTHQEIPRQELCNYLRTEAIEPPQQFEMAFENKKWISVFAWSSSRGQYVMLRWIATQAEVNILLKPCCVHIVIKSEFGEMKEINAEFECNTKLRPGNLVGSRSIYFQCIRSRFFDRFWSNVPYLGNLDNSDKIFGKLRCKSRKWTFYCLDLFNFHSYPNLWWFYLRERFLFLLSKWFWCY